MQQLHLQELSPEDLGQVLQRAQALEMNQVSGAKQNADLESFIHAAEEVGIGRDAVLQALREKIGHPLEGIKAGDRVFALSADKTYYVATVVELQDSLARVRFHQGSEHSLALSDLRGFSLLPGQKLEAKWPFWGWWNVEVEQYDPQKETVTVSDGFKSMTFPLTEIRLPEQKTSRQHAVSALLWRVGIVSAGIGGIVGALLMRFFS